MKRIATRKLALGLLIGAAALLLFIPVISRLFLNVYVQEKAETLFNSKVEIANAELHFLSASLILHGLKVYHPKRQDEVVIGADKVKLQMRGLGTIMIHIDHPTLIYKTTRRGNWELSHHVPLLRRGLDELRLPFNVEEIQIEDGEIDYIDRKISRKGLITKLTKLRIAAEHVQLPTKEDPLPTKFKLGFNINNSARYKMWGRADFLSPKISFDAQVRLRRLPLPDFAPYYQRKNLPVYITEGTMGLTSHAICKNDRLKAPATASLSGLRVKAKKKILRGLPVQSIVNALKKRNGNLEVQMMIKGNIRRPRFLLTSQLTRVFVEALTVGLARDVSGGIKGSIKEGGGGVGREIKKGVGKVKGLF